MADLDPFSLFHDLDAGDVLAIAVSGGSDSLALLFLADAFIRRHRARTLLLAVTVDHGLRPESASEAARVAALCAQHGIAHEVARWRGDKPATGLPAAAREARYRLLAEAAQRAGASAILTGHTLDDQAETLAMRAARGDGIGLAGMARATLFDGRVWIVRPLLGLRRQALRGWLGRRGLDWIADPTNDDPAYERVRVRGRLGDADVERLGRAAREYGLARQALAQGAGALVRRFADRPTPGLMRLDRAFFAAGDREAALLALRALLATAGGAARLPDRARTEALLARLAAGAQMRATLARAAVDVRRQGIFIRREARDLPVVPLDAGGVVWDGRMQVAAHAAGRGAGESLAVGPLGPERAKQLQRDVPAGIPPALARAALAAEPALFARGACAGALSAAGMAGHGVTSAPVVAPFARFLSGFDHRLAAALHDLVGAPALVLPPWQEHKATGA